MFASIHRVSAILLPITAAACLACASPQDATGATCTGGATVSEDNTLTSTDDVATVSTDAAHGECPATFSVSFSWADPARASSDSTMPPMPFLSQILHADSDDLYFPHDAPTVTKINGQFVWAFEHTDHNVAKTGSTFFYVKAYYGGTAAARDNVELHVTIRYVPF